MAIKLDKNQRECQKAQKARNSLVVSKESLYNALLVYLCTLLLVAIATGVKFALSSYDFDTFGYLIVVVVQATLLLTLFIYIFNSRKVLIVSIKTLMAICLCSVISYVFNLFFVLISPYILPIALAAFLIAPISERRDAFIFNTITTLMVFFALCFDNDIDYNLYVTLIAVCLSGVVGGAIVSYRIAVGTKRFSYIMRGIFYSLISLLIILLIEFLYSAGLQGVVNIIIDNWYYLAIAPFACILLGIILQPIVEYTFNIISNTRLVELTDHNNPLIKRLIEETPGTFNHCMAVANFAEVCAKAIGENPYMARAASYYHDIGKLINPRYFKENQSSYNPHDDILPELSANIIRNHTTDGYEICKQYRIPLEIADITIQHHGTLPIAVFYNKAKGLTDKEVDMDEYRYHGTTPRSKIAAIIMLCDSSEAAIRAMPNPDGEKINKLLQGLINDRIISGQFSDCDITIRDLDIVRMTIINIYGGIFHQRIAYPSGK